MSSQIIIPKETPAKKSAVIISAIVISRKGYAC